MYDKKFISENGSIMAIEEEKVTIPVRMLDHFVRVSEQVEAIKRMYYGNKGILCTSDVVAILGIAKIEEEDEND